MSWWGRRGFGEQRFEGEVQLRVCERRTERFRKFKTRVYVVEVGDESGIADLYVDPEARTLVWEGALEFEKLAHVVLEELPMLVWSRNPPPPENLYVGVALFFSQGHVRKGVLGRDISYGEHAEMLSSEELAAVRYSVASGEEEPPPDAQDYALTVEDLRRSMEGTTIYFEDGGFELSLQLSKESAWTAELFGWVIEHHAGRRFLRDAIDFEHAGRTISDAGWRG